LLEAAGEEPERVPAPGAFRRTAR